MVPGYFCTAVSKVAAEVQVPLPISLARASCPTSNLQSKEAERAEYDIITPVSNTEESEAEGWRDLLTVRQVNSIVIISVCYGIMITRRRSYTMPFHLYTSDCFAREISIVLCILQMG